VKRAPRVGPPLAVGLALMLIIAPAAPAQSRLDAARALLGAWHEEPARIERARALLEADADATPEALVELARAWMLTGDFRATSDAERAAAYERGIAAARRALAAAPRDERAHLLLAFNTGRLAQTKGMLRAVTLLTTLREESATVLRLNPSSVEGLILAGGLAAELPAMMGGDRGKAEALFARALQLDPHHTGGRMELARLYAATRRWSEAGRELQRVVDEVAPTERPRWLVSDAPRAAAMLVELQSRGYLPPVSQSP
jgi:hypothetical protein